MEVDYSQEKKKLHLLRPVLNSVFLCKCGIEAIICTNAKGFLNAAKR